MSHVYGINTGVLYKKLFGRHGFRENHLTLVHNALQSLDKIIPALAMFFDRFG
jgi:hypothetical protein